MTIIKKVLIFLFGIIFGAVFLGNGFYTITGTERNGYLLNKYTGNIFYITPSKIRKIDYRK